MRSLKTCKITVGISLASWLALETAEAWSPNAKGAFAKIAVPASSRGSTGSATTDSIVSNKDIESRRQFLFQSATAAFLSLQVWPANAEDEILPQEVSPPVEDAKPKEPEQVENNTPKEPDTEQLLIKEEKEVIEEIVVEETEERQASEDTNKLITELEEKIKEEENENDASSASNNEEIMQSTKNLIDNLEKEEEKLENETKELINKIETLEKTEEQQDAASSSSSPANTAETQEFLSKLKGRVEEKEDLISRLKRESQKDVDPKTGKFKAMEPNDFKARAPSDFDFLQYLKETVTNNKEFERDMEAFKSLLESAVEKVGKVVQEVR